MKVKAYLCAYIVQKECYTVSSLQHTDRTFYALDGSVSSQDSRVFIYPFDYLGVEPIAKVSPLFKEAMFSECEGLYCSEPSYIPVRDLIK